METVTVIFGVIHGWAGALWIAAIVWKKDKKALSVCCALVPIVAFIYGLFDLKRRWAPVSMMVAGSMIIMLA